MEPDALTRAQFAEFSSLIQNELGIQMPDTKMVMLQSRLQRRARALGIDTVTAYHRRFFSEPAFREMEMEELLNLATTNKTEFLREAEHFRILRRLVTVWRGLGRHKLRIWCAGCSTGEEAYTLSMVVSDMATELGFDWELIATDVSTRVLRQAASGRYRAEQVEALPADWRQRYFVVDPTCNRGGKRVSRDLRSKITFGHLNFLAPRYGVPGPFDFVFFRNVMIYFSRETQKLVVGKMLQHMRVGAHLFIAHAETLHGLGLDVEQVDTAVYQHKAKSRLAVALDSKEVSC